MVNFETNIVASKQIEVQELYAIYGRDKENSQKLLIIGDQFYGSEEIPVIDVTSGCHTAHCYLNGTDVVDVCEDFGISPYSARYIYDYEDFNLIFQCDERED